MLKGLRAAETAMNIQLTKTNVLANNLANVDTAGFKQVLTQVTEMTDGDLQQPRLPMSERGMVDQILDLRSPIDMTQGQLRETGRTFDVALMGDGLFKVSQDGQELYTRNGSFSLDAERRLSTADGGLVVGAGGPITIPDGEVVIGEDGMIRVNGAELDRLAVVDFEDSRRLQHVGGSVFRAPDEMPAKGLASTEVRVGQGMLERSNANPIDTMIGMIAAQRAFEMEAKVLQAADRTLDKSVNEISRKA